MTISNFAKVNFNIVFELPIVQNLVPLEQKIKIYVIYDVIN